MKSSRLTHLWVEDDFEDDFEEADDLLYSLLLEVEAYNAATLPSRSRA